MVQIPREIPPLSEATMVENGEEEEEEEEEEKKEIMKEEKEITSVTKRLFIKLSTKSKYKCCFNFKILIIKNLH